MEELVPTELILLMEAMEKMQITGESIKDWTQKDPTLSHIYILFFSTLLYNIGFYS